MSKKQNIFYTCFTFLLIGLCIGSRPANAGDPLSVQSSPILSPAQPGPAVVIDQLLSHIRARDRSDAFSLLSSAQHEKYHKNPDHFMKTLRVMYHAVYNHQTYRILTPITHHDLNKNLAHIQIQLIDHNGTETFGIIHLIHEEKDIWKINGITILFNDGGRNA